MNQLMDVTVGEMKMTLVSVYSSFIRNGRTEKIPSVMLWGAPGVGKSQGVRELAQELGVKTKKEVHVTDVRLLLFNPIDLRGIPTADKEKKTALWLRPKIFDMDPSDKIINILFLDELSSCPPSVQAAAYQIALDHQIGEHKLPKNCIVICAGNRLNDHSVVVKMPKALANRLLHFNIVADFDSWKEWAYGNNISFKVIAYLSYRRDALLLEKTDSETLAYPTPRSWEKVSDILNNVDLPLAKMRPLISGLVGAGTASEFLAYTRVFGKLPDIPSIFKGTENRVPGKEPDVLYALVSSMASYAKEHHEDLSQIENSIRYAMMMPPEFTMVLLTDYKRIPDPDFQKKLVTLNSYLLFLRQNGGLFRA